MVFSTYTGRTMRYFWGPAKDDWRTMTWLQRSMLVFFGFCLIALLVTA